MKFKITLTPLGDDGKEGRTQELLYEGSGYGLCMGFAPMGPDSLPRSIDLNTGKAAYDTHYLLSIG